MKNTDITNWTKEQIININPSRIFRLISGAEILYIAEKLGAFWHYDYYKAYYDPKKKPGLHALLKSGLHSDGFFDSYILLQYPCVKLLIASQMVIKINQTLISAKDWALKGIKPDSIAGVPKGAAELAYEISKIMHISYVEMEKDSEGHIRLKSKIGKAKLLLIDDVFSVGTGFIEAVTEIQSKEKAVFFLPFDFVILNRSENKQFYVPKANSSFGQNFSVMSLAKTRITTWDPPNCPLCKNGSLAIKPKDPPEFWERLITSQL